MVSIPRLSIIRQEDDSSVLTRIPFEVLSVLFLSIIYICTILYVSIFIRTLTELGLLLKWIVCI